MNTKSLQLNLPFFEPTHHEDRTVRQRRKRRIKNAHCVRGPQATQEANREPDLFDAAGRDADDELRRQP